MQHLEAAGAFTGGDGPNHWAEHLEVATMTVGTYSIPAGGADDQSPHQEDEVYGAGDAEERALSSGSCPGMGVVPSARWPSS